MNPKMSDEELRLAIAEIVAKDNGRRVVAKQDDIDLYFAIDNEKGTMTLYNPVPNYSTDIVAAMELLDEFKDYVIEKYGKVRRVIIWANKESEFWESENESLERAICEAWLTARRSK